MRNFLNRTKPNSGFSLLELVAAVAIGSLMMSWVLPAYRKLAWQGEVDRYTQMVEAGLFNLRSNLGVDRSNCCLNFNADSTTIKGLGIKKFGKPIELVESFNGLSNNNLNFTENENDDCNGHRLKCLPDDAFTRNYRLIYLENSRESRSVEVASLTNSYILSPPGTSTSGDDLTILIRSARDKKASAGLRVRCVLLTGNGVLSQGSWIKAEDQNRTTCPHNSEDSNSLFWEPSECLCSSEK